MVEEKKKSPSSHDKEDECDHKVALPPNFSQYQDKSEYIYDGIKLLTTEALILKQLEIHQREFTASGSCVVCVELNNRDFDSFPEILFGLRSLKELTISYTKIREIPVYIDKLSMLEKLDISHNNLDKLPATIGNLLELKCLDLSFNKFQTLSLEILNIKSLKRLYLVGNQLKSIPENINKYSTLEIFDVRYNDILDRPNILDTYPDAMIFKFGHTDDLEIYQCFDCKRFYLYKDLETCWYCHYMICSDCGGIRLTERNTISKNPENYSHLDISACVVCLENEFHQCVLCKKYMAVSEMEESPHLIKKCHSCKKYYCCHCSNLREYDRGYFEYFCESCIEKIEKEDPDHWISMTISQIEFHQFSDAIESLENYLELIKEKITESGEFFQQIIPMIPQQLEFRNSLAWLLYEKYPQNDEILNIALEILESFNQIISDPFALDTYARILFNLGNYPLAKEKWILCIENLANQEIPEEDFKLFQWSLFKQTLEYLNDSVSLQKYADYFVSRQI